MDFEEKRYALSDDDLSDAVGGAAGGSNSLVDFSGTVTEQLPNACFRVQLDDGRVVTAPVSGKLRMNYVRILVGDRVTVTMDTNDPSYARVTWRSK